MVLNEVKIFFWFSCGQRWCTNGVEIFPQNYSAHLARFLRHQHAVTSPSIHTTYTWLTFIYERQLIVFCPKRVPGPNYFPLQFERKDHRLSSENRPIVADLSLKMRALLVFGKDDMSSQKHCVFGAYLILSAKYGCTSYYSSTLMQYFHLYFPHLTFSLFSALTRRKGNGPNVNVAESK